MFYNVNLFNTGVGVDFGHSFDIGANYKVPYYTERQYLILGTDVSVHAGSFSWLTFFTPIMKLTLNMELIGAKIQPQLRGLFDITTYTDLCASWTIFTKGLELLLTLQLEVLDCKVGFAGTLYQVLGAYLLRLPHQFGHALDCDFRAFYFDKRPLVRLGLDTIKWWTFEIIPEMCLFKKKEAWEYQ
jgi:hypothetical protein